MRRLVVIGLSVVGAAALIWVLASSILFVEFLGRKSQESVAEITIENRSNELVVSGEVEFLGDTYSFSNVGLGETAQVSFRIRGEGGYRIRVRFVSGKEVGSGEGVYLTWGARVADSAEVTSDGITIRRRAVGSVKTAR